MDFDEWLKPDLSAQGGEIFEYRHVQRSRNQQSSIGAVHAGFVELIGVDDKILAQQRYVDSLSYGL